MTQEQKEVAGRLGLAVRRLEACGEFSTLVPEVRANIVYSLPETRTPADVAAVDGRITVVHGVPKASGPIRFGASDHLARRVIAFRQYDPRVRSCLNFRWDERVLEFMQGWCRERELALGTVDRSKEPKGLVGSDRSSMPWKVAELIRSSGGLIPSVFCETRGWGKEPLFLLTGTDPLVLADRMTDISRRYAAWRPVRAASPVPKQCQGAARQDG